jgi:hypothetical protein
MFAFTNQATREARAMFADLLASKTLADLDRLYVNWIGYSVVEDHPSITEEALRGDLRDYIKEVCAATGVYCGNVSLTLIDDGTQG